MLDLSHLNEAQKQAVVHKNGPLLIVAGAGTGKTTVITNRVAWLIEQGLAEPDEILCLTFTDKAAGEMEERIDKLLPYGYVDLWVMTFHAFCERVLKAQGLALGLSPNFTLLDTTSQWMLVQKHFEKFDLDYYKPLGSPTKFISAMLTHFSRAKDEGVFPEDYLDYVQELELQDDNAEFLEYGKKIATAGQEASEIKELWTQEVAQRKELASAYHTYQQLLHENEALDFGDLIIYAKKLFQERPQILEMFRKKFKYILVDEFQDTNWAQYDLVKLLAGKEANITVVGDDDQSIYKFRGASLSNILGFKKDFPQTAQVVLNTNYRSKQEILDLSYAFIQNNNPNRLETQEHEGFEKIDKSLKAFQEGKASIEHLHYKDVQEEAAGVIQKMIALKKEDPEVNWGDMAILVRANSSAEPFLQQLTLAEIPYQFMASQGLFSKPVILDLLSYFKVIDAYAESSSLYRILILPTIDLSNDDLMKLLHYAKQKSESLMQVIQQPQRTEISEEGIAKCKKVVAFIDKHTTLARTSRITEVAMAFMDDYGLKKYFETLDPFAQKETYGLLNHFWKLMQQFEQEQSEPTIKPFLEYLELIQKAGDSGSLPVDAEIGPDTVKVMTIHASKGLEFKHVFVVSLVDRRFPTQERKDALPLPEGLIKEQLEGDNQHLEEERRLCYVALTRAKEGLYLTSAKDYGGARAKKLSRFIYELGFEEKEPHSLTTKIEWGQGLTKSYEVQKAKEMDYAKYLPKTYSFTQLKVFQTCPWQYRYAFIMKIPVQGRHTFSFGKSMHNSLELFFNRVLESKSAPQENLFDEKATKEPVIPSLKELLAIYEEEWIDDWYQGANHKEEYYQKGKDILKAFYKLHQDNWPDVQATEKGFSLKVGGYTIRGSIDRIDKKNGKNHLIDYKTGSVPSSDRSLDKDQLLIYQIASEEVLGEEVEELTYYYLTEQVAKSFLGTDKQKDKLKEKIMATLDELTSSSFEPKPSQFVCKNCDYKDICQYSLA